MYALAHTHTHAHSRTHTPRILLSFFSHPFSATKFHSHSFSCSVASEAFLAYIEDAFTTSTPIQTLQVRDIQAQMRRGVVHANKVRLTCPLRDLSRSLAFSL